MVTLDGEAVGCSEEANYLRFRLNTSRALIYKYAAILKSKGKITVIMVSRDKVFSLKLYPNFITNICDTHMRSLLCTEVKY